MARASRRKYHFIYKTTCMVTSHFYIGLHSTDDLDDKYLGSGVRLGRSVKKYGKDQHVRQILEMCSSRDAASAREKDLLSEEVRSNPLCMNIGIGGLGASDRPPTSDETKLKRSQTLKRLNSDPNWHATRWANHQQEMNKPEVRLVMSESQKLHQNLPEVKALRSRQCTVDGITIFPSIKALGQILGRGKNGTRSPSFRFLEPDGPNKNVVGLKNAWSDPIKKTARLEKRQRTLMLKRNKDITL
jgi:hypothetical protein